MAVKDGLPATDFSRMNREYVKSVAENAAAAGGGGLPDITATDEGKVLTVENGEAAWAAGGSGGVLKIVDTDGTLDHTWNEIKSALHNGTYVSLVYSDDEVSAQTQVTNARIETGDITEYIVGFTDGSLLYIASSPDGYPVAD